jgi:tetratricopeptide (TPR) repeat protein
MLTRRFAERRSPMSIYPPGARIAGQYEVAGRPLMGGMGIVYVCNDLEEDRPVALKTFKPEYLPDRAARDRFLREGTAWVDLGRHPHIVRCYEVLHTGSEVYLVLELVAKEQGRDDASLRAWLTPGRPLPIDQALLFGLQIARGMAHATATIPGFVHRDLKPENVLVGADRLPGNGTNRLRVTDFGLAAVLQAVPHLDQPPPGDAPSPISNIQYLVPTPLGRTQLTHGIVGTPFYMAPEQWRGEEVTVATDAYALGCILFEMLAGQRAVTGRSLAALERAHCQGEMHPLPTDLPGAVRALVTRCLAVEPGQRYGHWEEVEPALAGAYEEVTKCRVPVAGPVTALGREERVAAGWSYGAMGVSYLDIGKVEVAVGYFQRAREVGKEEGERPLEEVALDSLGNAYRNLGDARRAIGYYEQALIIAREIGDRRREGNVLGNLGIAYRNLGNTRRAIGYYERHLAIAREFGDRHGEGAALGNLGNAYFQLGDTRRAIEYHEQALIIHREIGDRRREGNMLGSLGNAYANLGDTRRAIGYYEQHLAITRQFGDRRGEGAALANLGNAYAILGNTRPAIGYYEQALIIHREIGDRRVEGLVLGNLGNAYADLGDARRAIGYYEQCLNIHRETGDRRGEGATLGSLGSAYANLGDRRRAIEYYEQRLAIACEIGDAMGQAIGSFNLADEYSQLGETARALELAQGAAHLFTQIGHAGYAQRAQQLVVQLRAAM